MFVEQFEQLTWVCSTLQSLIAVSAAHITGDLTSVTSNWRTLLEGVRSLVELSLCGNLTSAEISSHGSIQNWIGLRIRTML